MVIDVYLALIVYIDVLYYNIIFGTNFLDKCGFHLGYENNLVHWIEYKIPFCDFSKLFSHDSQAHYLSHFALSKSVSIITALKPMQPKLLMSTPKSAHNINAFGWQHGIEGQHWDLHVLLSKTNELPVPRWPPWSSSSLQQSYNLKPGPKLVHGA